MQWRSRVSVELSAAARSFTATERAKVMTAGAGLATLVRSRRLRRPREEETSAPWSNRGLPLWRGLELDPAMLWVAFCAFMKPANSWPRACFPLQVAEGGTEAIRASEPSINRTCVAALGRGANARAAGQQQLARPRRRAVVWLLALAVAALGTADALAASRHKRVQAHPSKATEAERHNHGSTRRVRSYRASPCRLPDQPRLRCRRISPRRSKAIELVRQGKPSEATLIAANR